MSLERSNVNYKQLPKIDDKKDNQVLIHPEPSALMQWQDENEMSVGQQIIAKGPRKHLRHYQLMTTLAPKIPDAKLFLKEGIKKRKRPLLMLFALATVISGYFLIEKIREYYQDAQSLNDASWLKAIQNAWIALAGLATSITALLVHWTRNIGDWCCATKRRILLKGFTDLNEEKHTAVMQVATKLLSHAENKSYSELISYLNYPLPVIARPQSYVTDLTFPNNTTEQLKDFFGDIFKDPGPLSLCLMKIILEYFISNEAEDEKKEKIKLRMAERDFPLAMGNEISIREKMVLSNPNVISVFLGNSSLTNLWGSYIEANYFFREVNNLYFEIFHLNPNHSEIILQQGSNALHCIAALLNVEEKAIDNLPGNIALASLAAHRDACLISPGEDQNKKNQVAQLRLKLFPPKKEEKLPLQPPARMAPLMI